jgi:hypothetical protein
MDKGQKATEAQLKLIEKRINKEYKQAIEEIEDELTDYLRRFEAKDKKWQEWVENGTKTEEEYKQWRIGQMAVGKRWSDQKEVLAHQLYEVNETAKNYIKGVCPEVYAENFNFSVYDIEKQAHINTGFTLYSKESVEQLIADDPEVLPPVGKKVAQQIAEGKAVRWNKQQLQSVMIQGILQGDSIPKLASRLANTVGDKDRKAAIRNARTMATGAQNAGRVAAYKRAKERGADIEQMWMATLDGRTRHSHRQMDREVRPVGEPFSNKCEFPADPKGPAAEIYNCRCTLRAVVKGLERRSGQFRDNSAIDGMSYEEWKKGHSNPNPIDLPEKKAQNIKNSFINEYRYGPRSNGIMGSKENRNMTDRSMANSLRTSPQHILTEQEIQSLLDDARSINIPEDVLLFNEGRQTGFRDRDQKICVRGDVLPDAYGTSARDTMSQRAVLAHEYYGHYKAYPSEYVAGDWRDEYNASRNAALNTPNLTDEERRDLMVDAYDRQKEAGTFSGYDEEGRRIIYGY